METEAQIAEAGQGDANPPEIPAADSSEHPDAEITSPATSNISNGIANGSNGIHHDPPPVSAPLPPSNGSDSIDGKTWEKLKSFFSFSKHSSPHQSPASSGKLSSKSANGFKSANGTTQANFPSSGQDKADAWPFSSSRPQPPPIAKAPKDFLHSRAYSMQHERRGDCVIINNVSFEPYLRLNERNGSDRDAMQLQMQFYDMGFTVKEMRNATKDEMKGIVNVYSKEADHSDADCFVLIVLSHGDEGGIFAVDGKLSADELFEPFKGDKCLSLAGKPKIFITQACRGDQLDGGVDLRYNVPDATVFQRIPREADFLYAYSTVPGYYSWRNTQNGSWYIQCLCHELREQSRNSETEFLQLLTSVTRRVAFCFQSNVSNIPEMHQKKQVPSFISTLTKELYLSSK